MISADCVEKISHLRLHAYSLLKTSFLRRYAKSELGPPLHKAKISISSAYFFPAETMATFTTKSAKSGHPISFLAMAMRNDQPSISFKSPLMSSSLTVSNLLGPWRGDSPTGLMQRCREVWDTPLENLSDLMVATFLNQNIAVTQMLIEAKRRIKEPERDGSEYFEGQLLEAMKRVQSRA
ncbi:hypothetical protein [Pseudomonas sp. MPB03]|uniref:hypothetical protein n=1 Tax=Pseudomonas sp. MPB03 TaxID=3388489 RepID=UPI0039856527